MPLPKNRPRRLGSSLGYWSGMGVLLFIPVGLVAIVVLGFLFFAGSWYWQWHAGYGLACGSDTIAEAISPSKRWIARTRHVRCSDFADGGEWVEAVLVPNDVVTLFSRYRRVFSRELEPKKPLPKGSDTATPTWIDGHSLELRTAPCDAPCVVTAETDGITISIKP